MAPPPPSITCEASKKGPRCAESTQHPSDLTLSSSDHSYLRCRQMKPKNKREMPHLNGNTELESSFEGGNRSVNNIGGKSRVFPAFRRCGRGRFFREEGPLEEVELSKFSLLRREMGRERRFTLVSLASSSPEIVFMRARSREVCLGFEMFSSRAGCGREESVMLSRQNRRTGEDPFPSSVN